MFNHYSGGLSFSLASEPLTAWCENLTQAILQQSGRESSRFMNPNFVIKRLKQSDVLAIKLPAFEAYCTRFSKGAFKWGEGATVKALLVSLFKILQDLSQTTPPFTSVVTNAIAAVNAWIDLYRCQEAHPFGWMVPGLVVLLSFLAEAGAQADAQQEKLSEMLEEAEEDRSQVDALQQTANQQRVLNAIRQHIGKFRGDMTRQAGYVVLMSESIQACMALGNIQMASAFLKTAESSVLDVSRIPRAPLVSFRYHLGKLHMQQERFQKAEESLAWAFVNCSPSKTKLKRRIVECLTAVRLRMGKLPPPSLLERYGLGHYSEIVKAIKSGNIVRFEKVLAEKTTDFVEEGTLLCVEKLKFIVYRSLVQRVLNWAKDNLFDGESRNVVPINLFTAAFGWQLSDDLIEVDDEEMACIVANLIKLGYLKGYIAWEHAKIVFSKQNPVPPLEAVTIS